MVLRMKNVWDSLKNPTFKRAGGVGEGGFNEKPIQRGAPKNGGPEQFVDLRGGLERKKGGIFEGG